jgi:hypothetical protein
MQQEARFGQLQVFLASLFVSLAGPVMSRGRQTCSSTCRKRMATPQGYSSQLTPRRHAWTRETLPAHHPPQGEMLLSIWCFPVSAGVAPQVHGGWVSGLTLGYLTAWLGAPAALLTPCCSFCCTMGGTRMPAKTVRVPSTRRHRPTTTRARMVGELTAMADQQLPDPGVVEGSTTICAAHGAVRAGSTNET